MGSGRTGPAPTGFVLNVSGSLVGSFQVAGRSISGAVSPGLYGLSVFATNICVVSPVTPVQVITIPEGSVSPARQQPKPSR